jgi:hypothetical protein
MPLGHLTDDSGEEKTIMEVLTWKNILSPKNIEFFPSRKMIDYSIIEVDERLLIHEEGTPCVYLQGISPRVAVRKRPSWRSKKYSMSKKHRIFFMIDYSIKYVDKVGFIHTWVYYMYTLRGYMRGEPTTFTPFPLLRTGLPYTCRPVLLTVGALGSHALKVRA